MLHFRNGGCAHARVTSDRVRSGRVRSRGPRLVFRPRPPSPSDGRLRRAHDLGAGSGGRAWRARRPRHERALMNLEAQQALAAAFDVAAPRRRVVRRPASRERSDSRRAGQLTGAADASSQRAGDVPAKLRRRDVSARPARCRPIRAAPPDRRSSSSPPTGRIRSFCQGDRRLPTGVLNLSTNAFFIAGARRRDRRSDRRSSTTGWQAAGSSSPRPTRFRAASSSPRATPRRSPRATCGASSRSTTPVPGSGYCAVDSPTFGIDNAALYVGVVQFCDNGGDLRRHVRLRRPQDLGDRLCHHRGHAVPRLTGYGGRRRVPSRRKASTTTIRRSRTGFFIGVDIASLGTLMLRRIANPGAPRRSQATSRSPVPATAVPITVRHLGNPGGANGRLDGGDDRLTSASLVNGRLWTAHTIGVTTPACQRDRRTATACGGTSSGRHDDRHGRAVRDALHGWRGSAASTNATTGCRRSRPRRAGARSSASAPRARASSSTPAWPSASRPMPPAACAAPQLYTASAAPTTRRGRRAARLVAGGGAASRPPLSTAATARRSGRCSSSPTRSNSYGLQVGRTVGLGARDARQRDAVGHRRAASRPSICRSRRRRARAPILRLRPPATCAASRATIPGVTVNSVTRTGPTTVTINVSTVTPHPGSRQSRHQPGRRRAHRAAPFSA